MKRKKGSKCIKCGMPIELLESDTEPCLTGYHQWKDKPSKKRKK